jgi:hypothetical protein
MRISAASQRIGFVVAVALAPLTMAAQDHDHSASRAASPTVSAPATAPADAAPATAASSRHTMKTYEQMMADVAAREARLDSLVKTMDGTTGEAKLQTMAAVIRQMVHDEKEMRAYMHEMHAQMMAGHETPACTEQAPCASGSAASGSAK